jgi:hypothetical protein
MAFSSVQAPLSKYLPGPQKPGIDPDQMQWEELTGLATPWERRKHGVSYWHP